MQTDNKIIFFDGDCLLCNRFARFILKINRNNKIKFAPFDGKTALHLFAVNAERNREETVIYYRNGVFYYKSTAVIKIFSDINLGLRIFKIFYLVPRVMRDFLYDFVARNRNKFFTKKHYCKLINSSNNSVWLD